MLNKDEKKSIDILQNQIADYVIGNYCAKCGDFSICENKDEDCYYIQAIDTVLKLVDKQTKQLETIREYAHQEIISYTETIRDYIDDDKEGNKHIIGELKEDREHWKDIEKILQNKPKEQLYMNWWRYGLYE